MAGARTCSPNGLSRERVLRAALEIADTEGLSNLTMRRLAAQLDVRVMSLYRHVATKQDLLDGVVHLALAPLMEAQPSGSSWDAELSTTIRKLFSALRSHPGATQALADGFIPGAALDQLRDALLGILMNAGFDKAQAVVYLHTLFTYTVGFAVVAGRHGAVAKSETDRLNALPADRFVYLTDASGDFAQRFSSEAFEAGLAVIVEGLRASLKP